MMKSIKIYTIILTALHMVLLAVVLVGCSDEKYLSLDQPGAESDGESRAVKIAVTETDWEGHTINVTRAGETLEALKKNSVLEWNFTKTPLMDLSVLKADVVNDLAKWTTNEGKTEFSSKSAMNGELQANGVALYMTEDLTFSGTATAGDLRIDVDKRLLINKSGIGITLPSLKKGQEITIEFSTTSDTKSRNIVPSGSVSSTDAVESTSTSTHAKCVVTMTADGSPTFTVGTGTDGSSVYIYKISVTRAESDGFGLYCSSDRMKVINSHIVWDAEIQSWKGISNDAYLMLWPNNIMRCNVAFNGSDVQSKPGHYTFSGNHNFDSKFTGCTYDGITFTKGLDMEEGTTISFYSGISANPVTVTIVQSDWEDAEHPHGTPKAIKFDINGDGDYEDEGEVLDVAKATSITGGKVYNIKNVTAGIHTITRGSGESGIFYICVDIPFTAYSPYISDESLDPTPTEGIISRNGSSLVFKPHSDNRIDLMYAEHTTSQEGVVQLNFKHALGKLSIGTIYNDYGEEMSLNQITISGTRRTQGTLSLSTGEWSSITTDSENVVYGKALLESIFGNLDIPNKGSLTFPKDLAYTQIPGTTLTFEYQFKTSNNTTFTVSATMEVEEGKNKFVNITINQNHQVVLE